MSKHKKDPTEPICQRARGYAGVEEGTSCNQTSFKVGKQAFLYIGMQGGRYKAMFKLQTSRNEAEKLAADEPENYQVGSTAWVTARFTADEPLPKKLWQRWLDESHALSVAKPPSKKIASKRAAKASSAKKKSSKQRLKKS